MYIHVHSCLYMFLWFRLAGKCRCFLHASTFWLVVFPCSHGHDGPSKGGCTYDLASRSNQVQRANEHSAGSSFLGSQSGT